jgi:CSLREA domain-containing protein
MRQIIILSFFILAVSFSVSAATLKVTKVFDTNDGACDEDCSLREAINVSNNGDTIVFDDVFFNTNRIIELTLGELSITKNLTIVGTGANKLTIRRSNLIGTVNFRVFSNSETSSISNLTIAGGNTPSGGGGVSNVGSLMLTNVEIRDNTAYVGGGIYSNGYLTLLNSTVSNNITSAGAAGIDNIGTMTVQNTTISNNQAGGNGGGFINILGTATLRNVTVAFNTAAADGGGILNGSGTVILGNVLVADNSANSGQDISGLFNSEGYNFIENVTGTITGNTSGNIIGVNPLLDSNGLNANDGSTRTIALQPTSPAIDKGNRFGANSDQRGRIRPSDNPNIPNAPGGDGSDIGAYEVNNSSSSNSTYSGRVLSPDSRGVSGAIVSLTGPNGEVRFAFTNPFGYFSFQNVPAGIIYTFNVRHKRYTFSSQTVPIVTNSNNFK